ncbi:hypothetical protein ABEF95_002956 [Exophiala dermatitidis]
MPDPPAAQPAKAVGAKPTTTGPKPKPRAGVVRKTKAEREQFAKEEAERQKARLAEEAAKNARGSARGGRGGAGARGGRGGAAGGERAREGPVSVGSGVFGAGSGLRPGGRPRMQVEGHSEMLDGQQGFKYDESQSGMLAGGSSGGGGGGTRSGGGEGFGVGEDDELDEPKRDIERIWISSGEEEEEEEDAVVADDGDEVHKGKGKQKQKQRRRASRPPTGLRPVRAPRARRESEEDAAAAKKKAASSTTARSTTERRKPSVTIKKRASDAQEQPVADDHEGAMDVDRDPDVAVEDDPVFVKEQPSSPEMRRRSLRKASSSTKARDARLAIETIEEKAERLRVAEDTDKLRDFLLAAPQNAEDENVDEDQILEDGKLFLFQLPPMTPFLLDADLVAQQESFAIKAEPHSDATATVSTGGVGAGEVKKDPETGDVSGAARPNLETEGLLTASEPTRLPSGLVGKLRVHKSGKVSLDWGGTDMEVRYGAEVDFLQDVVMVTPPIKTEEGDENETQTQIPDMLNPDQDGNGTTAKDKDKGLGKAYALGQVRRKMVLIPDWEKLESIHNLSNSGNNNNHPLKFKKFSQKQNGNQQQQH